MGEWRRMKSSKMLDSLQAVATQFGKMAEIEAERLKKKAEALKDLNERMAGQDTRRTVPE